MKLSTISSVQNEDVGAAVARYADLKTQYEGINEELKAISDVFKATPENIIERNQHYIINHEGRSISFSIDRTVRATTDSKALAAECMRRGIDVLPFKRATEVQSFNVKEARLFE